MQQTLSQPIVNTTKRRVGVTNVTDLRRQWSTAGLLDYIAPVRTTETKQSTDE